MAIQQTVSFKSVMTEKIICHFASLKIFRIRSIPGSFAAWGAKHIFGNAFPR